MKEQIENGNVVTLAKILEVADLNWNKHATCKGVFLKHLVKGEDTDGKFSCHLVKIQVGCEISDHTHQHNWELHEVVDGAGNGYINGKEITYSPGASIVIPQGEKHRVYAKEQELTLLAKFVPALV